MIEDALPVADAVLFEGYLLYPYRASEAKNAVRWQFGVLVPPAYAELDPSERAFLSTDVLVDGASAVLTVRVRFLHVLRRSVFDAAGRAVAALDVDDATYVPTDEATVREVDVPVDAPLVERTIGFPGAEAEEVLRDRSGVVAGRLVRRWEPLAAQLRIEDVALPGPFGARLLRVRLDNRTPWTASTPGHGPDRPEALRRALVAAHVLAAARAGRFVSQLEPPGWASGYVAACTHVGAFPVLAAPGDDVVLASPIILYDHPELAPESTVSFCDATEMDEMLTLRAMTLTDAEKRQVRGSDPRAAGIVEQVDHLPPELLDRLHGAIRSMVSRPGGAPTPSVEAPPWWDPGEDASVDPDTDEIVVDGVPLRRGVAVRLHPGSRRADAQDMFLAGRLAHVEAVLSDVDGNVHLAVALDELIDDGFPAHGRFLYFAPDEVEPL